MCARIAILLLSFIAFAIGLVTPTLGQGVTGQSFVLPKTRAWTGDFSGMLKRKKLRLLVPYSKTLFFVDRGRQMGVVAEFARTLEASINARYKSKPLRFHVDLLRTARDRLFQALNKGYGDAVASNLTITPERLTVVDFVDPWLKRVKEIIVAGPSSPKLDTIEDLAGQEIRVRDSSVYAGHLAKLSDAFVARGLKPIVIKPIDDNLEDEDLIEMVNAGLLPYAVVDDHEATIWTKIFPNAVPRTDLVVSEGGEIACAIRKNSPELKAELNAFFRKHSASAGIFIPDTNAIESLNAKLRRAVRTRGHFPTDDATMKLLYLVLRRVAGEWKMPPREWCEAKTQFAIMFDERLVTA